MQILRVVAGASFNLLHICGSEVYFDRVSDYSAHAVNWATTGAGNPGLRDASKVTSMALVGGVDENLLSTGDTAQIASVAREAIAATGGARFLLGPGCTVKPPFSDANWRALRQSVESQD
jgi:uroporphyrinogen decarboxylase